MRTGEEDDILQHVKCESGLSNPFLYIYIYTGCPRRNMQYFGRVFLRSNYTDITQNTYIQSSMVTEIFNIEKWRQSGGLFGVCILYSP